MNAPRTCSNGGAGFQGTDSRAGMPYAHETLCLATGILLGMLYYRLKDIL